MFTVGIAIFLGFCFWLLVKYLTKNKEFLSKPKSEQLRLKNKFYWAMGGGLSLGLMLSLLIQNGITFWVSYLPIFIYFFIWLGGLYLLWLAYQLGVRKNIGRVKKSNGEPFNNTNKMTKNYAILNLLSGCAVVLMAMFIPLLKMEIKSWGTLLLLVLLSRKLAIGYFEKSDNKSGN